MANRQPDRLGKQVFLRGIADESPAAATAVPDVLVGTSAGATVAAQISSGCPLDTLYERQLAETSAEIGPVSTSMPSLIFS